MNTTAAPMYARSRERVRKCIIALEGGIRAFADFQVTPPLGSSMMLARGWGAIQAAFKESRRAGNGLGSEASRGRSFLHDSKVNERLPKGNSMV